MAFSILLIGIVMISGCTNNGIELPNQPGKSWVEIDPIQCLGNPWEVDWLQSHGDDYSAYPRDTQTPELEQEEIEIIKNEKDGFAVESNGPVTIALMTDINDDLRSEGFAREMINKIQNMRKSSGFEVTDRIDVTLSTDDVLKAAVDKHNEFICSETLADSIIDSSEIVEGENGALKWNINGIDAIIAVSRK